MKNLVYIAIILFAASKLFNCGGASTTSVGRMCFLSLCFGAEFELKDRELSAENKTFRVAGTTGDEYSEHLFVLGEHTTYEGLSFGMEDSDIHLAITAKKRLHILNEAAYKIYIEQYLRVKKQCPASFVHQNLETVLLIPASDSIDRALDGYDLPFSPDGTPFKLGGHFMKSDSAYFIKDGVRFNLTLATHEAAASNVGSAQHLIHYFLVTQIY